MGQGWAEEGGLPAARGQKGRKWGQGLTLHSPGPGKGGAGPGGSEQATAEQVTSEQGRARAAST